MRKSRRSSRSSARRISSGIERLRRSETAFSRRKVAGASTTLTGVDGPSLDTGGRPRREGLEDSEASSTVLVLCFHHLVNSQRYDCAENVDFDGCIR